MATGEKLREPLESKPGAGPEEPAVKTDPRTGKKEARGRRLYRKKDGSYWIENGTGHLTRMTRIQDFIDVGLEELTDRIAGNPEVDEAAPALGNTPAGRGQRNMLVQFAENADAAKAWVKKHGGIVREFGPGWDFGVKFDTSQPWRFIDPKRPGMVEFGMDLLDLTYDLTSAVATTKAAALGMAGGPVSSIGSAMATSGAMEIARQATGAALGIPNKGSMAEVGFQAAAGGIPTPGMGRTIGTAGRFLGEGTQELGSMLTRTEKAGSLSAREVFTERVMDPIKATDRLPSVAEASRDILGRIRAWQKSGAEKIAQITEADQIVSDLASKGSKISIRPMWEGLEQLTLVGGEPRSLDAALKIGGQGTDSMSKQAADSMDAIRIVLNKAGATLDDVPLDLAVKIRRMIDDRTKTLGGLGAEKSERASVGMLEGFRGKLQDEIAITADRDMMAYGVRGASQKPYTTLMHEGKRILDKMETFYERAGVNKRTPEEAQDQMVGFITGLYGARKSASMELLDWFEKHTGMTLEPVARRSIVGTKIGDEGAMGVIPRITQMGGAPTMLGQAVATLQTGLGMSPRNIVRLGQKVNALRPGARTFKEGVVNFVDNPQAMEALTYALQEAGRKVTGN